MLQHTVLTVIITININSLCCNGGDVFHRNSRIIFNPDRPSPYFGYAILLTEGKLVVGAPKARHRIEPSITSGVAFKCRFPEFETNNITCDAMALARTESIERYSSEPGMIRDDMWFGASIAMIPDKRLVICAPRWADPYKTRHLLVNGACYVEATSKGIFLTPLKDLHRLAFQTDGDRKEYGEYGTHLNFYAYAQMGMSIKMTTNSTFVLGAPGLMQWTGGVFDYRYKAGYDDDVFLMKGTVPNTYFTPDLGPDDYFGYSVDIGIFDFGQPTLYLGGAPRSRMGYGQVLIFVPPRSESERLKIIAKLKGPQLGAYFGASLCVLDIDDDGRSDVLVGAPNYVSESEDTPYDQGAVFVYMTSVEPGHLTILQKTEVLGDKANGARFGTTIAALGDIDADGFNDVAIGAPFENDGRGAVYIYRGYKDGLRPKYTQKLTAEGSQGYGFALAEAYDVDKNGCNDLAIGAFLSETAYLYKCVPTLLLSTYIKVPDAMNLPKNNTSFSALFCVQVHNSKKDRYARQFPDNKANLKATITIDPEGNRASTDKDEYTLTIGRGKTNCDEQTIEVKPTADLSKPILLKLDVEPMEPLFDDSPKFHENASRIAEDSKLNASFLIQLIRDCGDDLICTPSLFLELTPLNKTYIPGTSDKIGVKIKVSNEEEPAYGAEVFIYLPLPPKRVPGECSLKGLNMTCSVPAPLERDESFTWEVELEHSVTTVHKEVFTVSAEVKHPLFIRNENKPLVERTTLTVIPQADFQITSKALPNTTMGVTRDKFYENDNITFTHYFEITNIGPSDWPLLRASFFFPENVSTSSQLKGCDSNKDVLVCEWGLQANDSIPIALSYKYDLGKYGKYLEKQVAVNLTSTITFVTTKKTYLSLTTTLVLEPAAPIWPHIVGSIAGVLLLAAIVYGLHKYGFFSRTKHDELKKLQEESSSSENPASTSSPPSEADASSSELLNNDSE